MPDNSLIGKTIDNFRIERFLGQGGMAAVYEATDLRLQRQVAFKIMHAHLASQDSFRERFLNEAQAAASLDHPNIVRVNTFTKRYRKSIYRHGNDYRWESAPVHQTITSKRSLHRLSRGD